MEDGSVLSYGVYLSERNDRNFEDSERTVKELKDFFFKTLLLDSCHGLKHF
jgi:hypothetical protein